MEKEIDMELGSRAITRPGSGPRPRPEPEP